MKEKKHWAMLIIGLIAVAIVWYLIYKKKEESSYDSNLLILGGPLMQREYVTSPSAPSQTIPGVKPFALGPNVVGNRMKPSKGPTTVNIGCAPGSLMIGPKADGTYTCMPKIA